MFDRIKTKTVALRLFHHPARPVFNLFRHGMIAEIDILAHQIIEITEFIINLIVPAFAGVVVNNFKNAIFIRVFDMVDTAKTFEIPDKLRVLPGTGGEGVTRPAFALNDFFINLRTVISIYTLHANSFFSSAPILWLTTTSSSTAMSLRFRASMAASSCALSPYLVGMLPF